VGTSRWGYDEGQESVVRGEAGARLKFEPRGEAEEEGNPRGPGGPRPIGKWAAFASPAPRTTPTWDCGAKSSLEGGGTPDLARYAGPSHGIPRASLGRRAPNRAREALALSH